MMGADGILRIASACLVLGAVAACAPGENIRTQDRGALVGRGIVLAPQGLDVAGTGLEIGFGRAEAGAVKAAQKLIGRPPTSRQRLRECGNGPIDAAHWDDAVTLYFLQGDFVGWATFSDRFTTARGLTVGDGGDDLIALSGVTRRETPAGATVSLDGITGDLDAEGRVTRLHAGRVCGAA